MTTNPRSLSPQRCRGRRLRTARRLLGGQGRASFVAYRHDPTTDVDVLAHGLTPDGRLALVCTADTLSRHFGEEVVGDTHAVRLDLHREAACAEVRILVASAHLLGEVEWVSIAEQRRLVACGDLPEPAREVAWSDRNRVGLVRAERVVLHDSEGVAAWPLAEPASTRLDPSPWPLQTLEATDAVLGLDQRDLAGLCQAVGAGHARGRVLARRPVGVALAAGRRVHCLDTDPSGVTLLHVEDETETVVFAEFPTLDAPAASPGGDLTSLLPRSRS